MEPQSAQRGKQGKQENMEGFMAMDCWAGSPIPDDPLNFLGLSNFDAFNEPFSPYAADQLSPSFSSSYLNSLFGNCGSLASPVGPENARDSVLQNEGTSGDRVSIVRDRFEAQNTIVQSGSSPNSTKEDELRLDMGSAKSDSAEIAENGTTSVIPRSVGGVTLSERMLLALSLFKEFAGGGILAQIWMPVKQGDNYVLSTCEQPFLLDQVLAGYREISRGFTFSAKEAPGLFPGLPGRVFISGLPEWTSNIIYYNKLEYLRVDYAVRHQVRGSLAVPVFDPRLTSCCAVLELVTMKEKPNFDVEMENVCQALQAVDLKTAKTRAHHQNLTKNQRSAFAEILDVLRAVCHAHMLPLALTWVPIACSSGSYLKKENIICIQESACYVNDSRTQGFLRACSEHYLVKGQGIAGKALLSNFPFFLPDVKGYDVREYPLAHHARKFGLQAAVAIRLRSTYTGDDDYILEFFLPVNCKGSAEQQLLLNNLSISMQKICQSLRTVLEEPIGDDAKDGTRKGEDRKSQSDDNVEIADMSSEGQKMEFTEQLNNGSVKQMEKKRSSSEKHISLSVLQKYFAGSLKDAAKSLGVCPTTLKRICRQHGISRWPSRKIKKVNHSLKKIQSVIDSVQGVEGTLKYDPATGCLVTGEIPEKLATITSDSMSGDVPFSSFGRCDAEQFAENLEPDNKSILPNVYNSEVHMNAKIDLNSAREHSHHSMSSKTDSSSGSASSCPTIKSRLKNMETDSDKAVIFIVKATYKSDTVRFKFCSSMGCQHLYEEIGKRFRLSTEIFQVKYMDDEEEWVILMTDSDLLECIEVLESIDSHTMRLQVRDLPVDSSGSCSYLLTDHSSV